MNKIEIHYDAIKNAKGFEYADNREGVSCRLVPIEEAREQDKQLKAYKSIEKKLGIELTILFKALKNGIYRKGVNVYGEYNKNFVTIQHVQCILDIERKVLYEPSSINLTPTFPVKLKDYGKTWALTREELEK